jgi:hypothetical protein
MPDETDPQNEGTPDSEQPAAPDGTPANESNDSTAQDTTDWQSRYENQQGALTQAQQEAAQYRQIVDLARQGNAEAIEWLGLDLADEDIDEDEEQFRDPRVDELLAEREREAHDRQEQAAIDALEQDVEGEVASLIKNNGLSFDDEEHEDAFITAVFSHLAPRADDPNQPDVERAFKAVTGLTDRAVKAAFAGKRKAPLAPSGSSASHQPNLDDPTQRREWLASQVESG